VFQAMLENAVRICDAKFAHMFRYHDGAFHTVATFNTPAPFKEFLRRGAIPAGPETIIGQILRDPVPFRLTTLESSTSTPIAIFSQWPVSSSEESERYLQCQWLRMAR
jgi:hypothetical protein